MMTNIASQNVAGTPVPSLPAIGDAVAGDARASLRSIVGAHKLEPTVAA